MSLIARVNHRELVKVSQLESRMEFCLDFLIRVSQNEFTLITGDLSFQHD